MADLDLVVGTGSVLDALKQIGRLEGQVKSLTDRFSRGSVDQKTYSKGLLEIKRQYQALGMSSQKASGQVDKLSRGFRDNSKEIDRLRAKYNPLYATSKQYERALEEINRAFKVGAINAKQKEAELSRLHIEYANGTGQFAKYNAAMRASQKGMARGAVAMQQFGYQAGDFIVQVQSGTNAFVAFGQQATQMAGLLSASLNPKMVLLGTSLSIIIPLLTAAGAYFMRTRESAEDAVDPIDAVSNALNSLSEVRLSSLSGEFRAVSEEADVLLGKITELRTERLRESLEQSIEGILTGGEFGQIQDQIRAQMQAGAAGFTFGTTEFAEAARGAGISQEALDAYKNYYQLQQIMGQISGESAPELAQSLAEATAQLEEQGMLSPYLLEQIDKMVESLGLENELLEDNVDTQRQIRDAIRDRQKTLQDQIRLAQLELEYGEDSIAVDNERRRQARLLYLIELMREGVQGRQLANLMAQYDEYVKLNKIMQLAAMMPQPEDTEDPDTPPSGRSAAREGVGGVARGLLTEVERLQLEHDEKMAAIDEFNQEELDRIGGHQEAIRRLEEQHQAAMREIQNAQEQQRLSNTSSFFGNMASIAKAGGEKTFKIYKGFAIAQALVDAYAAFNAVLKDPAFVGRPWQRAAAAGATLAQGLAQVQNIRGITSSGGGGGGAGGGAVAAPAAAAAPEPQQVVIEGIDRDSLISGEQLSKLFDRLYEENDERGIVFSVAR